MDAMVRELAEHERSPELVEATPQDLALALFGDGRSEPGVHAHVVEVSEGHEVGAAAEVAGSDGGWQVVGMAVWYVTYSTWTGRHGMWLEDLYVRPGSRGHGLGRALMAALAGVCLERGYRRFEWWVLDWNAPAQAVYRGVGALAQEDWTTWRLDGAALQQLGTGPHLTGQVADPRAPSGPGARAPSTPSRPGG